METTNLNLEEKDLFLAKIEFVFKKQDDISELFNHFKAENNKPKVLGLVLKYREEGCFSEMVEFVRDEFQNECYKAYKLKIDKLLEVADVDRYEPICNFLLK